MKTIACLALALWAQGLSRAAGAEMAPKVEKNVSVIGFVDAGQVVTGTLVDDDGAGSPDELDGAFLNRNGIALTYSGTMNEALHVNIGVGGLFWKPIPEVQVPTSKRILFGPGISEASVQYVFSPSLDWKFGYFGYKYNPDAANLGEYLLRSEAYPTTVHTGSSGGWVWLNSAEYKSMGTRLSWTLLDGALRQDVLLFSEFNEPPIFDFSPSYVATARIGKALELGGGFSLHRWLPIKPSNTTNNNAFNTVVEVPGFPAFPAKSDTTREKNGEMRHKSEQIAFAGGTLKDVESNVGSYTDANGEAIVSATNRRGEWVTADGDTLRAGKSTALTFKALMVMARASLDLGRAFGWEASRSGPFRLFAEAAVLGVRNQPYFYEKVADRIPIMMGMSIPTFGLLDLLSVQLEYFQNPYPENTYEQTQNSYARPAFPNGSPGAYAYFRGDGLYAQDDLKWTVYLRKALFPGLDLFMQAANDHFRVQDYNATTSYSPVTRSRPDWYYMVRFQWGM